MDISELTIFYSKFTETISSLSSPLIGSFSGQTLPPLVSVQTHIAVLEEKFEQKFDDFLFRFWLLPAPSSSSFTRTPTTLWRCSAYHIITTCTTDQHGHDHQIGPHLSIYSHLFIIFRDSLRITHRTRAHTIATTEGLAIRHRTLAFVHQVELM